MRALVGVMEAPEPALAMMAAWALGRLANVEAIPALRRTLQTSRFHSVQIQASRALARFGDRQLIPWLKEHIHDSSDLGLQTASASGLGKLHVVEATPDLLSLLYAAPEPGSRREAGLALARLLGSEARYIQLLRTFADDMGTALALEMDTIRTRLNRSLMQKHDVARQLMTARDTFAGGALEPGLDAFLRVADTVASSGLRVHCRQILTECSTRIREFGPGRAEYVVLAVLVLERCGT
jgi:HEAT repeat protein